MTGIETLLVLTVAALDLAVVPWRIGTNELVSDAQLGSRLFKQRRQISLAARKTVGKLKAVVRLDALHFDPSAGIPHCQPAEKVR